MASYCQLILKIGVNETNVESNYISVKSIKSSMGSNFKSVCMSPNEKKLEAIMNVLISQVPMV